MKEIRIAIKIIQTLVKDSIHYPSRLYANMFIISARLGILLLLYSYVFKINGGTVNGVSFVVVAWSIFFYFIFLNFNLRRLSKFMSEDIQSGNIEMFLSKPISYLTYKVWWTFGFGFYNFLFIGTLGFIIMALIIGIPESMTIGLFIPTLLVEFILTSILTIIIYGIIGIIAFWVEDINPVYWIIDKFVMILGGSFLPIALFPDFLYKISIYSPFGASMFVSHMVYDSWQYSWYKFMGMQVFWIVVLGLFMIWLFKKAKNKVSVNGG